MITMNIVVLKGTLSSEPVERTLPSGTTVMDWNLRIQSDGPTQNVPVQWNEPSRKVQAFDKGDEVFVLGAVQRRFFQAGASLASRTDVLGAFVATRRQKVALNKLANVARNQLAGIDPG